jgi:UDP-GlcNAc:undecaprenyl-phosphate GlcNAc-1-phosphate transferase
MNATTVALIHWGFAAAGGLTAIGFLAAGPGGKLPIALVPLVLQIAWAGYVIALARGKEIGRW